MRPATAFAGAAIIIAMIIAYTASLTKAHRTLTQTLAPIPEAGVTLTLDEHHTLTIDGPCIVTINRAKP